MDRRALFAELDQLTSGTRRELSIVFQFAARGVAERLDTDELAPKHQRRLEHQYRVYASIARSLLENEPEKVLLERIKANTDPAGIGDLL